MARVFVYGTLKQGQPNHHRMLDPANGHAHFLAPARTLDRYPLVIAGDNHIPYLMNLPGEGVRVWGEVYRVDERMLGFLDAFERVPAMYQRTVVRLEVERWEKGAWPESSNEDIPPEGGTVEAHMYSTTTFEPEWRALPTHESYDAHGEHGLVYVDRESRQ